MILNTMKVSLRDRLRGFYDFDRHYDKEGKLNRPVPVKVTQYGKGSRFLNKRVEIIVKTNGKGKVHFVPTAEGHVLIKHTR